MNHLYLKLVLFFKLIALTCPIIAFSACKPDYYKNNFKISIPDTVFIDSCTRDNCDFFIFQKLGTSSGLTFTALKENCSNCNFTLSQNCHGIIVSPDSMYWYKNDPHNRTILPDQRICDWSTKYITDTVSKSHYRISIFSEEGTILPIRVKLNTRDTDNYCQVGFIPSLPRSEIIKSQSGELHEYSFTGSSTTIDSERITWSHKFLIHKFSPFDRLMRRLQIGYTVNYSNGTTTVVFHDTDGINEMNTLLQSRKFMKYNITRSELDSIRKRSDYRLNKMDSAYENHAKI